MKNQTNSAKTTPLKRAKKGDLLKHIEEQSRRLADTELACGNLAEQVQRLHQERKKLEVEAKRLKEREDTLLGVVRDQNVRNARELSSAQNLRDYMELAKRVLAKDAGCAPEQIPDDIGPVIERRLAAPDKDWAGWIHELKQLLAKQPR